MSMECSEVPFGVIKFEPKAQKHKEFKTWAESILAQSFMAKFLEDLGVLRPIQYAMFVEVERNPVDLAFLVSRWSLSSHTFLAAWGEFCPSLEDMVMFTGLPIFGNYHVMDTLAMRETGWSRSCKTRWPRPSMRPTRGHTFRGLSTSRMEQGE